MGAGCPIPVARDYDAAVTSGNGSPVIGTKSAVGRGPRPPGSRRVTARRARGSFTIDPGAGYDFVTV